MSQQGILAEQIQEENAVQQQFVTTSAYVSSSAIIPFDNTIPQIGEGALLLTVPVTPTKATNLLTFNFSTFCTASVSESITFALFEGAGPNAILANNNFIPSANSMTMAGFVFAKIAGTTSLTNYTVRYGGAAAATVYINGLSFGSRYGGVGFTSLIIKEYKV